MFSPTHTSRRWGNFQVIELIKLVNDKLNTVGRAHLEEAPQNEPFPYITFRFMPSIEDFEREIFPLEVNVWGNDPNTTDLEEMSDKIDHLLHRFKYYEKNILQTSMYRVNRDMVPDPDPGIRRRMLLFHCKTYIKRSE